MADFSTVGAAHETVDPKIEVTVDPQKPLPRGKMVFRLVVVDDHGNESVPDEVEVYIVDRQAPTAILRVLPAQEIDVGTSFALDASLSSDPAGGKIARYLWTRVS